METYAEKEETNDEPEGDPDLLGLHGVLRSAVKALDAHILLIHLKKSSTCHRCL